MAWNKVVKVVAVSACPVCGNGGFNFEPGADIDDPQAMNAASADTFLRLTNS
jgi:hypothetical protein